MFDGRPSPRVAAESITLNHVVQLRAMLSWAHGGPSRVVVQLEH